MDARTAVTAHHPDGTDYIDDRLERSVHRAITRYAVVPENSLAALAAINEVVDWIDKPDPTPTQREKVAAMTIDGITPTRIAWILGTTKLVVMYQLEQIAAQGPPDIGITGVPV